MKRRVTETALVSAVLSALAARRVFAWRNNSGTRIMAATARHERRVMRGSPAGSPDIFLIVPGSRGQLGQLECKAPRGVLSEAQVRWCTKTEAMGCPYGVVRSIGEALAFVKMWEAEWA